MAPSYVHLVSNVRVSGARQRVRSTRKFDAGTLPTIGSGHSMWGSEVLEAVVAVVEVAR
jgi:hypothetical protein